MAWRERDIKEKEAKLIEDNLKLEQEKSRKFEEFCNKIGENINKIESLPSNQVVDSTRKKINYDRSKQQTPRTVQEERELKHKEEEQILKDKLSLQ